MKRSQDEMRYDMWRKVITQVRGRMDRGDIMSVYLEQLNRCRFPFEFDECLDSIIENEKSIKYGNK